MRKVILFFSSNSARVSVLENLSLELLKGFSPPPKKKKKKVEGCGVYKMFRGSYIYRSKAYSGAFYFGGGGEVNVFVRDALLKRVIVLN